MDVTGMIKVLQDKDAELRREIAHRKAQRVAWALLDGSEVMEPSTGEVIVRMRTQRVVKA